MMKGKIDVVTASDAWNSIIPNVKCDVYSKDEGNIYDVCANDGLDKSDYSLHGATLFFEKYNCRRELRMLKKWMK